MPEQFTPANRRLPSLFHLLITPHVLGSGHNRPQRRWLTPSVRLPMRPGSARSRRLAKFQPPEYRRITMIADVRQHLGARPFEPFVIVTSSGQRYRVPSSEHAGTNPRGSRAVVWFDDESGVTLSGFHIVAVEKEAPLAAK